MRRLISTVRLLESEKIVLDGTSQRPIGLKATATGKKSKVGRSTQTNISLLIFPAYQAGEESS